MFELNVLTLLEKHGKSVYWLFNETGKTMSYQAFKRMINNETYSITYDYMERFCKAFNCDVSELFIRKEQ